MAPPPKTMQPSTADPDDKLDDKPRKAAKSDKIDCLIVAANYNGQRRGEEVSVTERELRRVGPKVLVTIEEHRKRQQLAERPPVEERAIESERSRAAAWKRMEEDRERLNRAANIANAKAVLETGGLKPPEVK